MEKNLFEYCNVNKKPLVIVLVHNGICVGHWFARQYKKINSTDDELYKDLSKNVYVSKHLDKYFKK